VKTCPNCGQATRDDDRFCASCGQPTDPRRQSIPPIVDDRSRRAIAPSGAASSVALYTHALRRFWWVLVIGAVIALLAALSARFTISLFPPSLEQKDDVSYTAESRLLITSADNPHFRAKETIPEEDTGTEGFTPSTPLSTAPDLNTIVRNANTYPYVIESDQVANYREQQYGDLPGTVQALGVTSVVTGNRIELSEIPIIRLIATADTPDDAINLSDKTGKAFIGWLRAFQDDNDILESDRIDVQQLNVPKDAVASEGPSTALPVVVFIAVFAAFCVLAVLLDRLIPAGQPKPARTDVEPLEPVEVKKTA
jgi:hypothetical protein